MSTETFVSRVMRETRRNGGATYSATRHTARHIGFCVGGVSVASIIPLDSAPNIWQSAIDSAASNGAHFGTWIGPAGVYVESVDILASLTSATALGKSRGELAIFDLTNGEEITL